MFGAKSESGLEIFMKTIGRNFEIFSKRGCLIEVVYFGHFFLSTFHKGRQNLSKSLLVYLVFAYSLSDWSVTMRFSAIGHEQKLATVCSGKWRMQFW